MSRLDLAMWATGVLSLATMAGLSSLIFRDAFAQRQRILAALRGGAISPAASDAPHASALLPSRRGDEAAAALTSRLGDAAWPT